MKTTTFHFRQWTQDRVAWLLAVAGSVCCLTQPVAGAEVSAFHGQIELPTYPWAAVKHPYFRGPDKVNIYPYPMLDFLSRERTTRTYRTVVLENEYLRLTFLPELGGKMHEVVDKTTGQPMFYVNHVIKPGLIGQCGAWTSGGVEWNTGPQGHTVSAMQPVPVVILPAATDGARSVAIGETERIYGTRWTVVVTLRPGRAFIEERIRIYNPTEYVRPYYFWNCTAVPNTPGFRFIYPMTLGTDHGAEKFFQWPIHQGKDLSRGTNYQDASSIFAWHCDQDFFGSYDDGADRGVVACANHHQVPGKKAWTWGQGGFGRLHQMDLTDDDGPYNEVQTGPLLTQGEVGRLDPCEAVEWQEWWYPLHGLGGFTFANQDVAVNATIEEGKLRLRMLGTAEWQDVEIIVTKETNRINRVQRKLSPRAATDARVDLHGASAPFSVTLATAKVRLAEFRVPLDLPKRALPRPTPKPSTVSELAAAAWDRLLLAQVPDAEDQFRKALEKDPASVSAHTGLAFLELDRNPAAAARAARSALATKPDYGLARLVLAHAEERTGNTPVAADEAWRASLDPATAVAGRALAAQLALREKTGWARALTAVGAADSPQGDVTCQLLQAWATLGTLPSADDAPERAAVIARRALQVEPLNSFARHFLWLAGEEAEGLRLHDLLDGQPDMVLDLAAECIALGRENDALRMIEIFHLKRLPVKEWNPLVAYWAAFLGAQTGQTTEPAERLQAAGSLSADGVFPYRLADAQVLQWATAQNPADGQAALLLGHVLFHLGRHDEGRARWRRAAELGAAPVVACRALGMAAQTIEGDLATARTWLNKANQADPKDAIVARDLAKVLFELAGKTDDAANKRSLWTSARDTLTAAFAQGRGRSDFVSLLGRAQNRLGEYAETARMLDAVRVTVWEGAREVHDLFEEAHLALGNQHLAANRPAEALAEFDRALEYPENLATGKLENAREAHIHYVRGTALAALGRNQAAREAWEKAAREPPSKNPQTEAARRQANEAVKDRGQSDN